MPSDRPDIAPPGEPPHKRRRHPRSLPPIRRRTRPHRWRAAVAELVALLAEYAAWLDHLPEALRDGATGEALQTIVDLDLDDLVTIEPPRGYRRD
jgi:hypothetical protein